MTEVKKQEFRKLMAEIDNAKFPLGFEGDMMRENSYDELFENYTDDEIDYFLN